MGIEDLRSQHAQGLLLEHLYHWEATQPDHPYLVQPAGGEVRTLTWRQTVDEARRIAAHLRAAALPAGSAIGLLGKSSAHWIVADLAIWMAGHVSVPIYSTASADNVRHVLTHSKARRLFVGKLESWDQQRTGVPAGLPLIALPLAPPVDGHRWDDLVATTAPIDDRPVRGADELATIVYTSGSTGTPKGVMLTFGAMTRTCIGLQSLLPHVDGADRVLCHLPLAHVAERLASQCGSLVGGYSVYFTDRLETFLADLQRARPTLFLTVPRLWQQFQLGVFTKVSPARLDFLLAVPLLSRLVRRKILRGLGLGHVRFAAGGAAPMPADLLRWYQRLGLEILEGYGMSENFGYSHANRPGRSRPGFVGAANPGVECRIAADGEIQMKSRTLMTGYYDDPALTAETFTADGFLRTGDRGEVDADGLLRITGRVKELFKTSKGKYVAPAPIENRLVNHPSIEAVCVGGPARPQPCAFVMLGADARKRAATGDRAALEASLGAHLAAVNAGSEPHEKLAFVAIVRDVWQPDNGFLTPTLKIKRAEIERAYDAALDGWYAAARPVVWQE